MVLKVTILNLPFLRVDSSHSKKCRSSSSSGFFLYNENMDSDDESLKILDDELKESERDGEEMLACGN